MKTELAEELYNLQKQIDINQNTLNRIKEATLVKFQNEENVNIADMTWLAIREEDDGLNKICYLFKQIIIKHLESEILKLKAEIENL